MSAPAKPPLFVARCALVLLLAACAPIRTPGFETLARGEEEQSVKPGINDPYLSEDLQVEEWTRRFEVESREIYHARREIVEAVGLSRAQRVADVGTGTGLFVEPLAREVGPSGKVFALDIAPAFVEHVAQRARSAGLGQVEARVCSEDSIDLPPRSIDKAFLCDVYHHFEFPTASLASIRDALRPGGELIVIDFERIPGVSSDWVLGHVRAGKEVVTSEIEHAGFRLLEEVDVDGLEENYFLRFRRR